MSSECIYMVFYTKLAKSLYITFEKKYIDIKITENVLSISICKLFVIFLLMYVPQKVFYLLFFGEQLL